MARSDPEQAGVRLRADRAVATAEGESGRDEGLVQGPALQVRREDHGSRCPDQDRRLERHRPIAGTAQATEVHHRVMRRQAQRRHLGLVDQLFSRDALGRWIEAGEPSADSELTVARAS